MAPTVIHFANFRFRGLSRKALLTMSNESFRIVVTANAQIICLANRDPKLRKILDESWITFDGQLPYVVAKLRNPGIPFEKISGSDFAYDVMEDAGKNGRSVFLLGGHPASNSGSVEAGRQRYGATVEGYSPPVMPYPFHEAHNQAILQRIREAKPYYLLVGFGAPKQEFWIWDNKRALEELGVRYAIGVGGTFDFLSGRIKRAPVALQRAGLEGLFRLLKEPSWFRVKRILQSFELLKYLLR